MSFLSKYIHGNGDMITQGFLTKKLLIVLCVVFLGAGSAFCAYWKQKSKQLVIIPVANHPALRLASTSSSIPEKIVSGEEKPLKKRSDSELAGGAPMRYFTHNVATVDVYVDQITVVDIPTVDMNKMFGERKTIKESTVYWPTQKFRLTIKRVIASEVRRDVPQAPPAILVPGSHIDILNSFTDQQPPFKAGDSVRVRVRLVSPNPVFNASDLANEWWFYPPGQPEEISPPRFPFEGIEPLK